MGGSRKRSNKHTFLTLISDFLKYPSKGLPIINHSLDFLSTNLLFVDKKSWLWTTKLSLEGSIVKKER